ncbi:MAG: bifunctional adenosylcobinamide kinase/adenosylcobinamide-phosphate guanylyltransferase [bacterium]|nr:bifunctional adenosylcobinamide kinase/adenosylcobinamide-phosphate guanylyltransferase [bacterium]
MQSSKGEKLFEDFFVMGRLIFITGGARSGKSAYAVELAKGISQEVTFIATCIPKDQEMKERIELHRKERPSNWKTIEEGKDVASILLETEPLCKVVIIDCLTFLISNLLLMNKDEDYIKDGILRIVDVISHAKYTTIVVSNEVGFGIVPKNRLGRRFRDIVGIANQIIARSSHQVYLMISGIPIKLKEGGNG